MCDRYVLTCLFSLHSLKSVGITRARQRSFRGHKVSLVVNCETQEEIDYFWEKLSAGGEKGRCGWIHRDRFGVTWQVVPTALSAMLSGKDPEKSKRAMKAMLKMEKIDVETLKGAYEGK